MTPRKNKSKEELVDDMKAAQERERQKVLIKTTIFPSLHDSCKNVADAKVLIEFASSMVQQKGLERLYKTSTKELDLTGLMNNSEQSDKYRGFFSSFDSLDIGATITILDQMKKGINNYVENKVDSELLVNVNIEEIVNK